MPLDIRFFSPDDDVPEPAPRPTGKLNSNTNTGLLEYTFGPPVPMISRTADVVNYVADVITAHTDTAADRDEMLSFIRDRLGM